MSKTYPEFAEELGRKALDKVAHLSQLLADGKITEREMWLCCDAIYDCMSGIADWDDSHAVYAIRQSMTAPAL